jgi:tetratricopeptide (TPR) repeat protein
MTLAAPLRAAVAVLCSLALALPASARAQDPSPDAEGPPSEDLSPKAEEHVAKAYKHHKAGAYVDAQAEFERAAFFAPRWRPLHYNLGVVAEAQGKLGTAIREYNAFRPHATSEETMVINQRIAELDSRRRKVAGAHRKQIAVGAIIMGVGVGATAGGAILAGLNAKAKENPDNDPAISSAEDKRKKLFLGGIVLAVYGLLVVGLAFVPLSKAVKSKRQLDGLALGRTRLRLTAGGAQLKF